MEKGLISGSLYKYSMHQPFLDICVGPELLSFFLRVSASENIEMGWCVLYKYWQRGVERVMSIQSTLGYFGSRAGKFEALQIIKTLPY